MAISRDTFDPRKRYELVQFQQKAVAVSDFELNELQQILHHKVEEFISTLIEGIDTGKFIADGFKVVPSVDNVNNFTVSPGVLLFRGKLIRLYEPVEYKSQTGVPPLTTPVGGRTDTVYVQITFNKEVTAADDPDIVDPLIQEETARRTKIDLKFLVHEGVVGAPPNNPSLGIYNVPLAVLNRSGETITSGMIQDMRQLFYGFVPKGADGKVPDTYLPPLEFIPLSEKGAPGGVPGLDERGKIPYSQLPEGLTGQMTTGVVINRQSWIAEEGQTDFIITNGGSYEVGKNLLSVFVGGVPQAPSAFEELSPNSFRLKEPAPAGVEVIAQWYELTPNMLTHHAELHSPGGVDSLAQYYLPLDGSVAMRGPLRLADDPTLPDEAVTKRYADQLRAGLVIKDPVRVATTENITLSGLQTIDGIPLKEGDRVLVKNQTDATQNGIWVVSSGDWYRPQDADNHPNGGELVHGTTVWVESGTVNGSSQWVLEVTGEVIIGQTPLIWKKRSSAEQIEVGTGLIKTGTKLSVDVGTGPSKIVQRNEEGKIPGDITGNADTVDGKHASDFILKSAGAVQELLDQLNIKDKGVFPYLTTIPAESDPGTNYPQGLSVFQITSENNWSVCNSQATVLTVRVNDSRVFQIAVGAGSSANLKVMYVRQYHTSTGWSEWQKIWTDITDGSGSGLDADLLDGLHATTFGRKDQTNTWTQKQIFNQGAQIGTGNSIISEIYSLLLPMDTRSLVATAWDQNTGLPTTYQIKNGSNVMATITVTYDSNGNPTQMVAQVQMGSQTATITFNQTFDSQGRFLQRTKTITVS